MGKKKKIIITKNCPFLSENGELRLNRATAPGSGPPAAVLCAPEPRRSWELPTGAAHVNFVQHENELAAALWALRGEGIKGMALVIAAHISC